MQRFKAIDLFSGAGGFSSGFRDADIEISASLESIAVFCKTHQFNFPQCKSINADIQGIEARAFAETVNIEKGSADVIIGGPPCQTFSSIGTPKINSLGEGDSRTDPRNYLYEYFFRYVDYYKPNIFLIENVPAMRTKYKGELFQRILERIRKLKYEPYVDVLNSVEYGVPQTRKRLFIVGTRDGIKYTFPTPTHEFTQTKNKHALLEHCGLLQHRKATTVYDALGDLPNIYDGCREDELPYSKNSNLTEYQKEMRNKCGTVRNNICRISNERAKKVFSFMEQGNRYMDLPEEVRKILPFREDIFHDRLKRLELSKPSWTVLAHIGMDGYMYIHPTADRTLSVREAARIQSFHDSFVFLGNMREQYVQVGNAVPPLLAKALADSIKKALR
ncbi:MAG TPA: DNA cytosine methyltransferase [Pyrinomonadaceae bacterium]|nr:DNA cytosine methyltransferase [Pyrinomonadaceae bacterium]